jgi:hypothetical protein
LFSKISIKKEEEEEEEYYHSPNDPNKWTIVQVKEFIGHLINVRIGEAFYENEINGQTLLLLAKEDLIDTMKIKLGPSILILKAIKKLRERTARTM